MAEKNHYVINGFPSSLIMHDFQYHDGVPTENGVLHITKLKTFTGDLTSFEFVAPSTGNFLVIKGVSIIGDGNTGSVKLLRSSDNSCIFPAYFSAQVKGSPSNAYNLILNPNEKILITTTSRSGQESFVGVSYIELNPEVE